MLIYQLQNAWRSMRRNPLLTGLLIGAIAVGVAISTASLTVYSLYAQNPIPQKSDRLFYVELDSWPEGEPFDSEDPDAPPFLLAYREAKELTKSDIPTHQSGMLAIYSTIEPDQPGKRPFGLSTRLCHAEFFPMFDVPFAYGSGWDKTADLGPEPVAVLDAETNDRLFGGVNSVGKTVRINNQLFTVVGVLKPWRPTPRFYDATAYGASHKPEGLFLPLGFYELFKLQVNGTQMCFTSTGDSFNEETYTDCLMAQLWVQLDNEGQKATYLSYLDAYVEEQKKLGRFPRPLNNRVLSVMELLRDQEVVPPETKSILLISLLFLLVCSVNLIGILLGKFLTRAPEMGVRRALGASRRHIFFQHLVECELIGIAGGLAGLALSLLVLRFVNRMLETAELFHLTDGMVLAGIVLSLLAGGLAGLYPAWHICRIPPARHLKLQ